MFDSKLYLLVTLGILAGCSTQPAKVPAANNASTAGTDVQCHSVQITGSMLSKTVCSSKADTDAERRTEKDLEYSINQHPAAPAQAAK